MELEKVVVRGFNGSAGVRWIVRIAGPVAYITNADGARAAKVGVEPKLMIGFPLADVFRLPDPSSEVVEDRPNWADLEPRFEETAARLPASRLPRRNSALTVRSD